MKAFTRIYETLLIESILSLIFSALLFFINDKNYFLLLNIGLVSLGITLLMTIAGSCFKLFIYENEFE